MLRRRAAGRTADALRRTAGARRAHSNIPEQSSRTMQPLVRHVAGLTRAFVLDVEYATRDVKQFTIAIPGVFQHQPGQWVDVFLPEIDAVGGYSIASAPSQLSQVNDRIHCSDPNIWARINSEGSGWGQSGHVPCQVRKIEVRRFLVLYVGHSSETSHPQGGTITLAIKASNHAPTVWMHRHATPGTQLYLRAGGSFVFAPPTSGESQYVFKRTQVTTNITRTPPQQTQTNTHTHTTHTQQRGLPSFERC